MAITKEFLSDAAAGAAITVNSTGVDIHTAGSDIDEVWLWATNPGTSAVTLTIGWAGKDIVVSIPHRQGLVLVVPGLPVTGLTVDAQTDVNTVNVVGYVNRVS